MFPATSAPPDTMRSTSSTVAPSSATSYVHVYTVFPTLHAALGFVNVVAIPGRKTSDGTIAGFIASENVAVTDEPVGSHVAVVDRHVIRRDRDRRVL